MGPLRRYRYGFYPECDPVAAAHLESFPVEVQETLSRFISSVYVSHPVVLAGDFAILSNAASAK
jgi:hypothetical protein